MSLIQEQTLLVGPILAREAVTAPRRTRWYVSRCVYAAMLFLLMCTAWLVLAGTQLVRNLGDLALFGQMVFGVLAPLQLVLAVFFSALFAASAVSQEKDRRTLVLLLMTRLTNAELVLGKLLASMLNVLMLLAAAVPIFMFILLFGGVSVAQVVRTFAVTLLAALVAGSLGSVLALWREKTFQALALTALVLVAWTAGWEAVAAGMFGGGWGGVSAELWATVFSPWRAVLVAGQSFPRVDPQLVAVGGPVGGNLLFASAMTLLLNGWAILRVRVWNPSAAIRRGAEEGTVTESIWGAEHDLEQAASTQPVNVDASSVAACRDSSVCHEPPGLEQSDHLAGNLHLGLRSQNPGNPGQLLAAIRGRLSGTVCREHQRRGADALGRVERDDPAVRLEPGVGQRDGRHVAHHRARRSGD